MKSLDAIFQAQLERCLSLAQESERSAGLSIGSTSQPNLKEGFVSPLRFGGGWVSLSVIVTNVDEAVRFAEMADGKVNSVFVDAEKKIPPSNFGPNDAGNIEQAVRRVVKQSQIRYFRGNELTARSAENLVETYYGNVGQGLDGKVAFVHGLGNLGSKIATLLVERGCTTYCYRRDKALLNRIVSGINASRSPGTIASAIATDSPVLDHTIDVFFSSSNSPGCVGVPHIKSMSLEGILVDAGKGTVSRDAVNELREKGIPVVRLEIGYGWTSQMAVLDFPTPDYRRLKTEPLLNHSGYLVPRGLVGSTGDIIVDRLPYPTRVFGRVTEMGGLSPLESNFLEDLVDD